MQNKMELPVLNNSAAPRAGMNRRQMVQRLAGAVGAGMAIPGVVAAHPIHKHLTSESTLAVAKEKAATADWTPEFLDPHQNETLTVLAERIVPGSTAAQVNRFIDLLLTVDTQENQKKFLAFLSAFEAEAINRHRQPFKDLTEDQQNAILTTASTEKSGQENSGDSSSPVPSKEGAEEVHLTLRDHFENMKTWVSGAYYSSEAGIRELGWTDQVMWDSYPGCQHPEGHH
ncbi:MAG TPA: gluconate 2-dehydrogenase subunit 3 family protein [Terriglobia bacterium]|nr:gluconate 2-dehydrogenase subunit 3 family protein [Terriglobia bacterium]